MDAPPDLADAKGADGGSLSPELRASAAWIRFKAFWRRLDAVVGRDGGRGYASSISATEHDQWLAELAELAGTLEDTGLLGTDELTVLRQVATARIEVMLDGGYRYEMFLHRAPSFFERGTEDSLGRLETRIDVLENLRTSCLIEPAAHQAALVDVEREVLTLHIMDQFAALETQPTARQLTTATDASPALGSLEAEDLLAELEKRVQALQAQVSDADALSSQLQLMENRLSAIRQISSAVRRMVHELERCE